MITQKYTSIYIFMIILIWLVTFNYLIYYLLIYINNTFKIDHRRQNYILIVPINQMIFYYRCNSI
jgi:hypothetical protein